jgi:hypothetical protein
MRQVQAEALRPIHPVILLEVPSIMTSVFLPVLDMTLAVPLLLFLLSLPSLLFFLRGLAALVALRTASTTSQRDRLADRPRLGLGLVYLEHRLCAKSFLNVISPPSLKPFMDEEVTKISAFSKG